MRSAVGILSILGATAMSIAIGIRVSWAQSLPDTPENDFIIDAVDHAYFIIDAFWKFVLCCSLLYFFRPTQHRAWAALFSFLVAITTGDLFDELFSSSPWDLKLSEYFWAGVGGLTAILEYLNIHLISNLYNYIKSCLKLQQ